MTGPVVSKVPEALVIVGPVVNSKPELGVTVVLKLYADPTAPVLVAPT